MPQRTDWPTLVISIAVGIVSGVGAAFVGVAAGLPIVLLALVTGGVVAAIVPLIYRLRPMNRDRG